MHWEIGRLLETLIIGLTGKDLRKQKELLIESRVNVGTKISKSNDSFGKRLADESEDYMLRNIVKGMDDSSIEAMRWKLRKAKYAIGKFQDILFDELRLRNGDNDYSEAYPF